MKNHNLVKIAGVLLLAAVMLIPASIAVTKTDMNQAAISLEGGFIIVNPPMGGPRDVLYDNGLPDGVNGLSCVYSSSLDRLLVDDFSNAEDWQVTGGEYRIVLNNAGTNIDATEVSFWEDIGGVPSTTAHAEIAASITVQTTGNYYFSRPELLITCSFDAVSLPAGTWWVCFQPQVEDNSFWLTVPAQGSGVYVDYPDMGYPRWTSGYTLWAVDYSVSFLLTGSAGPGDTTPPVTTCTITGTYEKTVTLTAVDEEGGSGVDYTKYKLDDGEWTTYTAPFVVSEVGDHIVYFYSVDKAGNVEEEKNKPFSVPSPVTITIKGGLGVSAVITNAGTTTLTNIPLSIDLDGSLIFVGKSKSGTIASLEAGASETVKSFVLGFGKTGIAVDAGGIEESASGTVILFLVLGVA